MRESLTHLLRYGTSSRSMTEQSSVDRFFTALLNQTVNRVYIKVACAILITFTLQSVRILSLTKEDCNNLLGPFHNTRTDALLSIINGPGKDKEMLRKILTLQRGYLQEDQRLITENRERLKQDKDRLNKMFEQQVIQEVAIKLIEKQLKNGESDQGQIKQQLSLYTDSLTTETARLETLQGCHLKTLQGLHITSMLRSAKRYMYGACTAFFTTTAFDYMYLSQPALPCLRPISFSPDHARVIRLSLTTVALASAGSAIVKIYCAQRTYDQIEPQSIELSKQEATIRTLREHVETHKKNISQKESYISALQECISELSSDVEKQKANIDREDKSFEYTKLKLLGMEKNLTITSNLIRIMERRILTRNVRHDELMQEYYVNLAERRVRKINEEV